MRNNYLIFMSACLYTFRAPHSSTVSLSWTTLMRKLGVWSSSLKITPFASVLAPVLKKQTEGHSVSLVNLQSPSACRQHQWTSTYFSFADNKWKSISLSPMVVSQNFSSATSLAMLAPIRTLTSIASFSRMMSEMSFSPSGPSSIPWMTTIRRRGMYLVPSGLEVMDSLCSTTTSCDAVATEQYEALWSDGTLPHLTWRTAILLWWVISRWFPPWRELSSGHRCCRWIDEGSQTPGSLLLWRPLWHLEQPPDEVSTAELVLRTASDHREPKRVYKQFKHSDLPNIKPLTHECLEWNNGTMLCFFPWCFNTYHVPGQLVTW